MFDDSQMRISTLLGTPDGRKDVEAIASLTKYGLGTKRSLDQLISFTGILIYIKIMFSPTYVVFPLGIDFRNKKIIDSPDRCSGGLTWVPFETDSNPIYDSSDIWGFAPERRYKLYYRVSM